MPVILRIPGTRVVIVLALLLMPGPIASATFSRRPNTQGGGAPPTSGRPSRGASLARFRAGKSSKSFRTILLSRGIAERNELQPDDLNIQCFGAGPSG